MDNQYSNEEKLGKTMTNLKEHKFSGIKDKDLIVSFRLNRKDTIKIPLDYFISVAPLRIH